MGVEAPGVDKLLTRYEPDSLTLLSPIPSVDKNIENIARRETETIRRNFGATNVVEAASWDVAGSFNKMNKAVISRSNGEDVALFCLGTKPQALALGLCGLIQTSAQVVCRVPDRYIERPNAANGWSCLYDIYDTSNPLLA
jgi:hypothetical protein